MSEKKDPKVVDQDVTKTQEQLDAEALAQEAKANAEAKPKAKTQKLVEPEKLNIFGTVVAIGERKANADSDGVFKRDTKIVTIEDLLTQVTHPIFVTVDQWKAYNCADSMFSGNVVNVQVELAIKGETGYKENKTDTELVPHTETFQSFNAIADLSVVGILTSLTRAGVPVEVAKIVASSTAEARAQHVLSTNANRRTNLNLID